MTNIIPCNVTLTAVRTARAQLVYCELLPTSTTALTSEGLHHVLESSLHPISQQLLDQLILCVIWESITPVNGTCWLLVFDRTLQGFSTLWELGYNQVVCVVKIYRQIPFTDKRSKEKFPVVQSTVYFVITNKIAQWRKTQLYMNMQTWTNKITLT